MESDGSLIVEDVGTVVSRTPVQRQTRRAQRVRRVVLPLTILGLLAAFSILIPIALPYSPTGTDIANRFIAPTLRHPMGTDNFGRDIAVRIAVGVRLSIFEGVSTVLFALIVGPAVGIIAAYIPKLDTTLMSPTEILQIFPRILVAIALVAILGNSFLVVLVAIGLGQIPFFARLARSVAKSVQTRPYVEAGRALGATHSRLIIRHILPETVGPLLVYATVRLGDAILAVSYLSFLGLGPAPPTPELGLIVANSQKYFFSHSYMMLGPSIILLLLVLSINWLGDALIDLSDNRAIEQGS